MPRASEDPEERHADGGHGGARAGGCRWKAEDRVGHDVMETAYVRDPGSEAKVGCRPRTSRSGAHHTLLPAYTQLRVWRDGQHSPAGSGQEPFPHHVTGAGLARVCPEVPGKVENAT